MIRQLLSVYSRDEALAEKSGREGILFFSKSFQPIHLSVSYEPPFPPPGWQSGNRDSGEG